MPIAVRVQESAPVVYDSSRVEVGRRPSSDVVLTDAALFNVHPRWIERDGDRLRLRDSAATGASQEVSGAGVRIEGIQVQAWLCQSDPLPDALCAAASDAATAPSRLADLATQHGELARRVAANPSAPGPTLARLGQGFDRITLASVTANPSTPAATLYHLGSLFPGSFWANPQLPLMMLLDPALSPLSAYQLSSLVSHPAAPIETLRLFSAHPSASVRDFAERALRTRGALNPRRGGSVAPMKNSRGVGRSVLLGATLMLGVVSEASAAKLGKVLVQPSFETAGVYITLGDDSGNESIAVAVKGPGDADFHPVHGATRFEPHGHASSLFGLAPDTDYSVRVTLSDPDGVSGDASSTTTLHTRAEAPLPAPVRVRWVGPSGHDQASSGGSKSDPYLTPAYALKQAKPGDEIRVLAGTYGPISSDGLHATEAAPIVLRADDPAARPVIDGGASGSALYLNDASWLVIDGFEIRNGGGHDDGHGVYLRASSHVAVRHCFIHDNGHDNILISKGAQFSGGPDAGGFHLIEDSEIGETDKGNCDPSSGSNTACSEQTYYGIKQDNNAGGGTVIRRNRVYGHDDNTSPCGDEFDGRNLGPDQAVLSLTGNGGSWTNHDLEIYDNTFEDAKDDGIELDGICVNARVFRNTVKGAQNAFSAAPVEPGPYFIVRNIVTGAIGEAVFKLNTSGNSAVPSRNVFVYHNDFVRSTAGTLLNAWFAIEGDHNVPIANLVFRNNVFSTPAGGACINSFNHGKEQPSLDGDLWYTTSTSKLFTWWNGSSNDSYDTFAAWQSGAKTEPGGAFGDPKLDADFHPSAGSPVVDHAVAIAGINDVFVGSGPDVGAFELGAAGSGGSGSGGSSSGQGGSAAGGSANGGSANGGSGPAAGSGGAGQSGSSGQTSATGGTSTGGTAGSGTVGGAAGQGSSGASASGGSAAGGPAGAGDASGDADDGGCGCRTTGRGPEGRASALALIGLAGLIAGRRSRRTTADRSRRTS